MTDAPAQPIRLLHFADIHIGMENYGRMDSETGLSSRVRDFVRRLDDMIDHARTDPVDLVVFAGDAFKTRTPNPTYQREFAYRITELAGLAPVVLLVGNHDMAPSTLKASSIDIYETLAVPNVWVAGSYATRTFETARGSVVVGAAPYPHRDLLLAETEGAGQTMKQIDQAVESRLADELRRLAAEADQHACPRILAGHFTVSGATVGSERGIMLGRDLEVMQSLVADPRWDYVALGHIHKHQNLTAGRDHVPPVVYAGSMERIDFGEENDLKGYCRAEVGRGHCTWRFQRVAARPFVTLSIDLRRSLDPTADALREIDIADLAGAVVRVILLLTPETDARLREADLREALRSEGGKEGLIASIRREVEAPARSRLGISPEGLTDPELLDHYFISLGKTEAERAELLALATDILATPAS